MVVDFCRNEELLARFLFHYGYYEKYETAEEFVKQAPESAYRLAQRIAEGTGEEAVEEFKKI